MPHLRSAAALRSRHLRALAGGRSSIPSARKGAVGIVECFSISGDGLQGHGELDELYDLDWTKVAWGSAFDPFFDFCEPQFLECEFDVVDALHLANAIATDFDETYDVAAGSAHNIAVAHGPGVQGLSIPIADACESLADAFTESMQLLRSLRKSKCHAAGIEIGAAGVQDPQARDIESMASANADSILFRIAECKSKAEHFHTMMRQLQRMQSDGAASIGMGQLRHMLKASGCEERSAADGVLLHGSDRQHDIGCVNSITTSGRSSRRLVETPGFGNGPRRTRRRRR